jgi:hypothetical protein
MPKHKKKSKQKEDEDFDDMLAELRAADLATASITSSVLATSSSSSSAGMDPGSSMTSLPSSAPANVAGWHVSEEAIVSACERGDMALLQMWGRQGVRVRTADPLCKSAFIGASFDVISCLVKELGADVNQRDERGFTALLSAAEAGQQPTVRYLVEEFGADVKSQDNLGETPLYVAAILGHLAVVRTLINLGADIDRSDNKGCTPLMAASAEKYPDVVKWLVKAGADTQAVYNHYPNCTAASFSRNAGASAEQTAYLEAKTNCSSPGCSGAGVMKCTGCTQARYCAEACQLAHWKAHKVDCRR